MLSEKKKSMCIYIYICVCVCVYVCVCVCINMIPCSININLFLYNLLHQDLVAWKTKMLLLFLTVSVVGGAGVVSGHCSGSESEWDHRQISPHATIICWLLVIDHPLPRWLAHIVGNVTCSLVCLITRLCPTLWEPIVCSPPGSSAHRIFQVRILEWVAISFSRESFWPRDRTQVSCFVGRVY